MFTPCFIFGTRPEIVKLSPLVAQYAGKELLIHTGQHFDELLDSQIRSDVDMRPPDIQMGIGGYPRHDQVSTGLQAIVKHLNAVRPSCLIVQGDTNSSLIGALAGEILEIPVVHVESGLRSFDRRMPEERNRVLVDHCSDVLLPPTQTALENLIAEGLAIRATQPTGNTGIDSLVSSIKKIEQGTGRRTPEKYALGTFHRPENVDNAASLKTIFDALSTLDREVIVPVHPRLKNALSGGDWQPGANITLVPPLGYLEMVSVLAEADLVVSDSGGLIEECSYLKVPLISVRQSTERQEAFPRFALLVEPKSLGQVIYSLSDRDLAEWKASMALLPSPYGEGDAAVRIANEISEILGD